MTNKPEERLDGLEAAGQLSGSLPVPCRSHPNSIENLPFDILYEIVLYIVRDEWEAGSSPNAPLHLSQISRSLRKFTMDAPALWSRIFFETPNRPRPLGFSEQSLWLCRSQDSPLHLTIRRGPEAADLGFSKKALSNILKLLLPHIGRWRSLKVTNLRLKGFRVLFDKLGHAFAPELEVLTAHIPSNDTRWRFLPFGGGAPKLWSLDVGQRVAMHLADESKPIWPGLRRLTITAHEEVEPTRHDFEAYILHISQVLDILRRCENLEEFYINRATHNPENYRSPFLVHVPNLKRIDVSARDWNTDVLLRQELLTNVNAPLLMDTKTDFMLTTYNIPILLSHPSFPLPLLRSISFETSASGHASACHILKEFSNLRSLTFEFLSSETLPPFTRLLSTSLPLLQEINMQHLEHDSDISIIRHMVQARQEDPTLAALSALQLVWFKEREAKEIEYAWFRANVADFRVSYVSNEPGLDWASPVDWDWSVQPPATWGNDWADWGADGVATPAHDLPGEAEINGRSNGGLVQVFGAMGLSETNGSKLVQDTGRVPPASSPIPGRRRYRKARQERNAKKAARIAAGLKAVRSPPGRSTYARQRGVPWRSPRTSVTERALSL